ncbi:MAG TPA: hypothetical protein VFD83_01420 [Candidatus Polarisedimenticolia bacterium]|nr:hypothetical protein [Candidatus Polarisedimenticolia bacterium]
MVRASTRAWIAAASFLLLLSAALLVTAAPAQGASSSKSRPKATADTARVRDDEGISVRVIDGGGTRVVKHTGTTHKEVVDESDVPDTPDVPEPPDTPDHDSDNDLVRFGQDIDIPAGKVIEGSVVAMGGNITVRGIVRGDATAVGGSVAVRDSGVVDGNAVSVGGATTVEDEGKVHGSQTSVGGPSFRGNHMPHMVPMLGMMGLGAIAGVVSSIVQLLITLFLAWLALLLIRERMVYAVDRMSTHFGKSLLWGLVAWMGVIVVIPTIVIVGAIAMVILVITIIGIPVAILLAIAMVFALIGAILGIIILIFLGSVNGSMYLGRLVLHRRSPGTAFTPMRAVVVGTIVILGLKVLGSILGFVGVVFVMPIGIALSIASAVLWVVLTTAGMGAMVLTRLAKGPLGADALPAAPMAAAPPGAGWYSPPPVAPVTPSPSATPVTPPPPASPPPEPGSSDAP